MAKVSMTTRTMIKPVMQILRNQTKGRVLNGGIGKQCRQKFHHCANTTRRALELKGLSSGLEKKSLQKFPLTINPCRHISPEKSGPISAEKRGVSNEAGKSGSILEKMKDPPTANPMASESRPINPAASKEVKLFYFDTLRLANKFQSQGFTQQQSFCMVEAFIDVLNTSIEHHTKNMVTKPQQEIMVQQLVAQIGSVKKDMVILEKSEFTMLRNETEKQTAEIKQMKSLIKDEISKLQGNVKLDVNLERSRAVEAHAENEKQLQILRNKIDTDVANLRTTYEQYRNDVMKFASGTVISCAAIMLGVLRLMS
jgi:hypothetical protein